MAENEKLPEYNPIKTCPKCGREYPIWRLHLYIGEKAMRLAHNFCPADDPSGKIVELCMKCKMDGVVEKWRKDKS
ncbi:MAG: hypothetical protein ABSA74_04210 [Candidatus Staskawiczbacteria bacterium]